MTNYRCIPLAAHACVVMKDGRMMLMKDGTGIAPMDFEITLTDGRTVMLDGTVKSKGGKAERMTEGQVMTLDGKLRC